MIDTDRNRSATRRWFTAGWKGDVAYADELFLRDFSTNGVVVGPEGPKRNVLNRLVGFPDLETHIDELIATDEIVVIRMHWTGTHTGIYSGVAPTGRGVVVRVISIWRFDGDRVCDNWTIQDQFSLLQQVGYLSPDITGAQVPAPAPTH
jgi:predicted ester cyclase